MASGNSNILVDSQKGFPNAYYDSSKPYPEGAVNVPMEQYRQDQLWNGSNKNINFSAYDMQNLSSSNNSRMSFDQPKMFRKMRLYVRSQRKIGWLTRKDKQGIIIFQDWIDENHIVTEKPIYDNSLVLTEKADNLIYGEHIDWEWSNEWRHFQKISANTTHPFWKGNTATIFDPIYLDGERIKYHFTGDGETDVEPPFEGRQYKMKGVRPVPIVEMLAPFQITHNIAMNKVPLIMLDDIGLALSINKLSLPTNRPGIEATGDPIEDMMDNLRKNKVFDYQVVKLSE